MFKKIALACTLALLNSTALFAHALWIQTAPVGKAGQKQTIRIIYAEPGETPEKIKEWYSDVKDFELWLTGPDNEKVKLSTTAGEDAYTADFTPAKDGVYTLSVGHTSKDLGGKTVYQFNASALVRVGKAPEGNNPKNNGNELSVFADQSQQYRINKPVRLQTFYKSTASEKLYVSVASPSGWSKQVETDANGVAEFTPIWPGTYFIEASKNWKEEGQLHGKDYTGFWRAATLLVDVAK